MYFPFPEVLHGSITLLSSVTALNLMPFKHRKGLLGHIVRYCCYLSKQIIDYLNFQSVTFLCFVQEHFFLFEHCLLFVMSGPKRYDNQGIR